MNRKESFTIFEDHLCGVHIDHHFRGRVVPLSTQRPESLNAPLFVRSKLLSVLVAHGLINDNTVTELKVSRALLTKHVSFDLAYLTDTSGSGCSPITFFF
jgi:hypothetical protein